VALGQTVWAQVWAVNDSWERAAVAETIRDQRHCQIIHTYQRYQLQDTSIEYHEPVQLYKEYT